MFTAKSEGHIAWQSTALWDENTRQIAAQRSCHLRSSWCGPGGRANGGRLQDKDGDDGDADKTEGLTIRRHTGKARYQRETEMMMIMVMLVLVLVLVVAMARTFAPKQNQAETETLLAVSVPWTAALAIAADEGQS